jgi:hypothetical protein
LYHTSANIAVNGTSEREKRWLKRNSGCGECLKKDKWNFIKVTFFIHLKTKKLCKNLNLPSKHLPTDHINYWMVEVEETPGTHYNWRIYMAEQAKLKKIYKGKCGHRDPDNRPEFNQPDADWR